MKEIVYSIQKRMHSLPKMELIQKKIFSYNDKGLLTEKKFYEEDPNTGITHKKELQKILITQMIP